VYSTADNPRFVPLEATIRYGIDTTYKITHKVIVDINFCKDICLEVMGVKSKLSKVPDSISLEIVEDAVVADMIIPRVNTTSAKINNISP
jgi:hypothetical protein